MGSDPCRQMNANLLCLGYWAKEHHPPPPPRPVSYHLHGVRCALRMFISLHPTDKDHEWGPANLLALLGRRQTDAKLYRSLKT